MFVDEEWKTDVPLPQQKLHISYLSTTRASTWVWNCLIPIFVFVFVKHGQRQRPESLRQTSGLGSIHTHPTTMYELPCPVSLFLEPLGWPLALQLEFLLWRHFLTPLSHLLRCQMAVYLSSTDPEE